MLKINKVVAVIILAVAVLTFSFASGCDLLGDAVDTDAVYKEGYDAGYAEGKTDGAATAKLEYQSGYDAGKAAAESGLSVKYNEGYSAGYAAAKSEGKEVTFESVGLEVHFVDVGQGDAIVLRFADGTDMLVDAGSGTSESSAMTTEYINYLKSIDIGVIDYMIVTHAHSDHMNMLDNVLAEFEVKNVYYNGYDEAPTTKFYTTFEEYVAKEAGATVTRFDGDGDTYDLSGESYSVKMYAPGYATFSSDVNYNSPIILVEYAGVKVLLTGDAEEDEEKWFINKVGGESLDIDILKVGHHGSTKGTSNALLSFTTPEFAVISVGETNTYNHPMPFTMNDLFNAGIITYRTNRHGNIVLKVDADGDYGFAVEKKVPVENNLYSYDDKMI